MQVLANTAAQLLREKWSIVEDLFWSRCSHSTSPEKAFANSEDSDPKWIYTPHTPPPPSESESWWQCYQTLSGHRPFPAKY